MCSFINIVNSYYGRIQGNKVSSLRKIHRIEFSDSPIKISKWFEFGNIATSYGWYETALSSVLTIPFSSVFFSSSVTHIYSTIQILQFCLTAPPPLPSHSLFLYMSFSYSLSSLAAFE